MSSSFTNGTTTVQPDVVDGWSSSRDAKTIVQTIVDGDVDVILYPASPRAGSLTAVFARMQDALTLEQMLAADAVVIFADSDIPALNMSFVTQGRIELSQSERRKAWIVTFSYQQVTA